VFVDRVSRAGRFLEWKVRIFTVAAALVLAGMYLEARWMTWTALLLLIGAMSLRFLPGGAASRLEHDEDPDADESVHDPGF
jgi:hypothetical protein